MKKPKISVILPFSDSEETIGQAIESILAQTFTDFELLLINQHATDSCKQIAVDFASRDKRIVLLNESGYGIVKALNIGLKKASAPIIARMDAEDISLPTRLEKQYNFLKENPKIDVVACQVEQIQYDYSLPGMYDYVRWSNKLISAEEISVNRFVESPIIYNTLCFRAALIDKYGPFRESLFPENYEMFLRWLDNEVVIAKISEVLFCWTEKNEHFTRNEDQYSEQTFYELKTAYLVNYLAKTNRFYPKVVVWGAGKVSRNRFQLLHELGAEAKFYIDVNENQKRKVIQFKRTPVAGNNFILCYVANRGAREEIKEFLLDLGYYEGKDFLCFT